MDINVPSELDYIILESLDYIKLNKNLKIVHIVQLTKDIINIGRAKDNDIIDFDISVSRNHAYLNFNKETGKLILRNKNGKFGTLVLVKGNIKMKESIINFQVGNTCISSYLEEKGESTEESTN